MFTIVSKIGKFCTISLVTIKMCISFMKVFYAFKFTFLLIFYLYFQTNEQNTGVVNKGLHAADLQYLFVLHCIPGSQRAPSTGEPSLGIASTARTKAQLNGSRPPQTPTQPSLMGPHTTPASRLPRKTLGPSRSLTEASVYTELSESAGSTQGEPNKDLHSVLERKSLQAIK